LILWKQCFWFVNDKGFPKELETVVRDLWGLRLSLVHGGKGPAGAGGDQFSSMGFSSTSEGETSDSDGKSVVSSRSRRSEVERDRLPRLIETLALCYLGTLLMRLPTSIGEIYSWAAKEEMVFARAVSFISLSGMSIFKY
jgi:RNA polymerase I-specific transcription initiation factor RRN7